MQEIWKDIKGYEGLYQVSNLGRIKSLPRDTNNQYKNGLIMKPYNCLGYLKIQLRKNGNYKWFCVHRLVAMAFLKNYNSKLQVNHKNGNKDDNNLENLEMVTASENQLHSYRVLKNIPSMKNRFGNKHVAAKAIYQFDKNNIFIKKWSSIIEAAKTLNICACNITDCAKGNRKTAGGFVWKYTI